MLKTADDIKKQLALEGSSISALAREHHVERHVVDYVLKGGRALRGEAHRVAVLLGLKTGVIPEPRKFPPSARRQVNARG